MEFSSSCAQFYVGVPAGQRKILLCGHTALEWRYTVLISQIFMGRHYRPRPLRRVLHGPAPHDLLLQSVLGAHHHDDLAMGAIVEPFQCVPPDWLIPRDAPAGGTKRCAGPR